MNLRQVINRCLPTEFDGLKIPPYMYQSLLSGEYSGQGNRIRATRFTFKHPDDMEMIGYDLWRGASLEAYAKIEPFPASDPIHRSMEDIVQRANKVESVSRWTKACLGIAALMAASLRLVNAGVDFIEDNSDNRSVSEYCNEVDIAHGSVMPDNTIPCSFVDGQVVNLR